MTELARRQRLRTHSGAQPAGRPTRFLLCSASGSGAEQLVGMLRRCGMDITAFADIASGAPAGWGAITTWEELSPYVVVARHVSAPNGARPPARGRWRCELGERYPGLRYLHLLRRDKQAQAAALAIDQAGDHGAPSMDRQLADLRAEDWRWIGFFAWARIDPITVAYEDLAADPGGSLARILAELGVPVPKPEVLAAATAAFVDDGAPRMRHIPVRRAPVSTKRPTLPVSIVVVAHNEGENLRITVDGLRATVDDAVEILVVDDWSTDNSADALDGVDARVIRPERRGGVTGARNAGAAQARGDVLVFADAHVDPAPGWLPALCAALADPAVGCATPTITQIHQRHARGHGFTWREPQLRMAWLRSPSSQVHEVPFICGCLMAFRRGDFDAVGGFDAGLVRWGSEDAEICLNLWRRGRACVVVPDAEVAHLFRPRGPYRVQPHMVVHNALRLAATHLPESAMRRVISGFRGLETFPVAYAGLLDSDVWERRERIAAAARHDGAWFLDRFQIGALR